LLTGSAIGERFSGFDDDTNTRNKSLGIIGGTDAEVGELPWQISLQSRADSNSEWSHFCGGSIIEPNKIATAARCCRGMQQSELRIVAGASNLAEDEPSQQFVNVKSMDIHPKYNRR